ncbi:25S rRNA (adenine645-N1)-methyltransferase [Oleoguttula sp. CCFEE 5521]
MAVARLAQDPLPAKIATMFAVKGWKVDPSTLTKQTEVFKSAKAIEKAEDKADKTRKRKRRQDAGTVSEVDLGKQWERHVEGKKGTGANSGTVGVRDRKMQKKEPATGTEQGAEEVVDNAGTEITASTKEKKSKKKRKSSAASNEPSGAPATADNALPPAPPTIAASAKLTPMQSAMRQKLVSARFRHLNQTLYTAPSAEAQALFTSDPKMFEDYHAGFRQQVDVWPENPVDTFISTIRQRAKIPQPSRAAKTKGVESGGLTHLPTTKGTCIIADLGCGDARLARTLTTSNETSSLNLKLHSFDLHSPSKYVVKADISSLPLEDNSVDVAIFCLALMGTNWISFIEEAYRILHWKGELWVAEIKSRFGRVGKKGKVVEHSVGSKRKAAALAKVKESKKKETDGQNEDAVLRMEIDGVEPAVQQETDVSAFVEVLKKRGFVLREGEGSVDLGNKMFVEMEFIKAAAPSKGTGAKNEEVSGKERRPMHAQKKFLDEQKEEEVTTEDEAKVLKPCLYKIR